MTEEERLREIIRRLARHSIPLADNMGDVIEDVQRACQLAGVELPQYWPEDGPSGKSLWEFP